MAKEVIHKSTPATETPEATEQVKASPETPATAIPKAAGLEATGSKPARNVSAIDGLFPELDSYKPKPGSENMVHVLVTEGTLRFSPETGERIAKPIVLKCTEAEYKVASAKWPKLGYTEIKILHRPAAKNA